MWNAERCMGKAGSIENLERVVIERKTNNFFNLNYATTPCESPLSLY